MSNDFARSTLILIDPRKLLTDDGYTHLPHFASAGYEVYEKASFNGQLVERVMVANSLKSFESTVAQNALLDGLPTDPGPGSDLTQTVDPVSLASANATIADLRSELHTADKTIATLRLQVAEPSDEELAARLAYIKTLKKDELIELSEKLVRGEDPFPAS